MWIDVVWKRIRGSWFTAVKSLFFFKEVSVKGGASPSEDVPVPPQGIQINVKWVIGFLIYFLSALQFFLQPCYEKWTEYSLIYIYIIDFFI